MSVRSKRKQMAPFKESVAFTHGQTPEVASSVGFFGWWCCVLGGVFGGRFRCISSLPRRFLPIYSLSPTCFSPHWMLMPVPRLFSFWGGSPCDVIPPDTSLKLRVMMSFRFWRVEIAFLFPKPRPFLILFGPSPHEERKHLFDTR